MSQYPNDGEELKSSKLRTRGRATNQGSELDSFCAWEGDTLVLNILGTPNASTDAIGKPKGNQLRISVIATPVAGTATDHMVRFLAGEFGVAVSDVHVVFGRFNVNKQLRIKSPKILPAVIRKHLSPDGEKGETLSLF